MTSPIQDPSYRNRSDILRHHGLIVVGFYCITDLLSYLTPGRCLRRLPRKLKWHPAWDRWDGTIASWWQDAVFLFLLLVGVAGVQISRSELGIASNLGSSLAAYVVLDSLLYLARVIWFDDIRPGLRNLRRGVSSHRRIALLAALTYAQLIYLYQAVYRFWPQFRSSPDSLLLQRSFRIATSLSIDEPTTPPDVILVSLALFTIAVAIAVTASVAYKRHEFAPPTHPQEPA